MRVCIIIPCYDEAARLQVDRFVSWGEEEPEVSLLFVDDGSTDGTAALLAECPGAVLRLPVNGGKAEAVRAGMRALCEDALGLGSFDAVGVFDADLSAPLREVLAMRSLLEERPDIDVVLGSRVLLLGSDIERRPLRFLGGRGFATVSALLLGLVAYDTQCGAKLWRVNEALREALEEPFLEPWLYELELLARLRAATGSHRAVELPLQTWHHVDGSKVRPADLPRALRAIWRLRRVYGHQGRP